MSCFPLKYVEDIRILLFFSNGSSGKYMLWCMFLLHTFSFGLCLLWAIYNFLARIFLRPLTLLTDYYFEIPQICSLRFRNLFVMSKRPVRLCWVFLFLAGFKQWDDKLTFSQGSCHMNFKVKSRKAASLIAASLSMDRGLQEQETSDRCLLSWYVISSLPTPSPLSAELHLTLTGSILSRVVFIVP